MKIGAHIVCPVVSTISGVSKLVLLCRGKYDNFEVRLGSVSPTIDLETMMNVVSHSDHPIKLTDWGFIESDGRFNSFRMSWETGNIHNEEISSRGSSELSGFGQYYETGYVRRTLPFGAYAMTTTQRRPRFCFSSAMTYRRRVWIGLRLWFQPNYLSWDKY